MTSNRQLSESEPDELLGIYLNDHRAGAAAGTALARRCLHNNRSNALGIELAGLVTEIKRDLKELEEVMRRLEVPRNPAKIVMARLAEAAGRFKLNGQIVGYSPLSRVIEIEALISAITAKSRLWAALGDVVDAYPALAGIDFAGLESRAQDQVSRLVEHHIDAVSLAFEEIGRKAPGSRPG
jgi:hypothetical protein